MSAEAEMSALARFAAGFSPERLAAAFPAALRLLGNQGVDPRPFRSLASRLGIVEAAIVEKLVGPPDSIDDAYAAVRAARTPQEQQLRLGELLRLQQKEAAQMREFFLNHRLFDPTASRQARREAEQLLEAHEDPSGDDDAS